VKAAVEFTLLFLLLTITMLAAWRGWRAVALGLFGLATVIAVAVFRHHATDALTLSF
jgi:hypothetical protein